MQWSCRKVGGDNTGGDDASDEEKVDGDNTGGGGASDEEKVGADNSGGDGAYSQGACNDEEEVGGHSCRDAFDFEENEEPWGAFI